MFVFICVGFAISLLSVLHNFNCPYFVQVFFIFSVHIFGCTYVMAMILNVFTGILKS